MYRPSKGEPLQDAAMAMRSWASEGEQSRDSIPSDKNPEGLHGEGELLAGH